MGIEEEWLIFKRNIRPHAWKVGLVGAIAAYPLYKDQAGWVLFQGKQYLARGTQKVLAKDEPLPKVLES